MSSGAVRVSDWVVERDPIRIVPLQADARPSASPRLVYNGGPLLTSVEVFTIYWGGWWQTADGTTLIGDLDTFFDYVLTSPLIDQLGEYSTAGSTIGHGRRTGTTTLTDPAPASTVSDASIQQMLGRLIADGTVPASTANSLYFLYLPPNVAVTQGGSQSCQAFCGYHNATNDNVFYAVMPYPGCTGCTGGLEPFDALTSTSSHELCEAITDPVPGEGWYDNANGEIGDICAWQTRQLSGYTVQLEWSNRAGRCV
jgi:hypothetical protein